MVHRRALAALLVVALLAPGATGAMGATTATDTPDGEAVSADVAGAAASDALVASGQTADAPNGSGSVAVSHFSQGTLGETVRIPVTLGNASAATITVGGPSFNYVVNATLRDGNGDDLVVVLFHTTAAGYDAPTLTAANASDSVRIAGEETALDDPLEPADYDVSVARGTDPDAAPVDEGTLVVHDSAWQPTPTGTDEGAPREIDAAGNVLSSVPFDAAGTVAIGVGLALLSLRLLFVAQRR